MSRGPRLLQEVKKTAPTKISFVNATTNTAASTSITFATPPSGYAAGDVAWVVIACDGPTPAAAPSGWTRQTSFGIHSRVLTASESSVTFTGMTGSTHISAVYAVFRGVDNTTVFNINSGSDAEFSLSSLPTNATTPTKPRTMAVSAALQYSSAGSPTLSGVPATYTLAAKTNLGQTACGIAYKDGPVKGVASGTQAWTLSAATTNGTQYVFFLQCAGT